MIAKRVDRDEYYRDTRILYRVEETLAPVSARLLPSPRTHCLDSNDGRSIGQQARRPVPYAPSVPRALPPRPKRRPRDVATAWLNRCVLPAAVAVILSVSASTPRAAMSAIIALSRAGAGYVVPPIDHDPTQRVDRVGTQLRKPAAQPHQHLNGAREVRKRLPKQRIRIGRPIIRNRYDSADWTCSARSYGRRPIANAT